MTPKVAQLLLALEPGVPYDHWQAARRAGLKAAQGVTMRTAGADSKLFKLWEEDETSYIQRELPGYSILSMKAPEPILDAPPGMIKDWEALSLPEYCLLAFATLGRSVVAVVKMNSPCAFIYHHDVATLFPTSSWERTSPAAIKKLASCGVLTELAEDELATFYATSALVTPPQRGRGQRQVPLESRRTSELR